MSRDADELTVALAMVVHSHADATALVMRKLNIDFPNADAIVSSIRFGIRASETSWAYTEAMNRTQALGVDWPFLLAIVNAGEATARRPPQ